MPQMLLINPAKRRAARPKKRRATRRRNPINNIRSAARRVRGRVMNPSRRRVMRRRRNPIRLAGAARSVMTQFTSALVGAGGAIAIDIVYGKAAAFLPPTLQVVKGSPGLGDAVKGVATVMLGKLLDKPTRGMASKAALGALTVQMHGIVQGLLPASLMPVNGLAYYSPAQIANMSNRVGPVRRGMNAYTPAGRTQLLNAYTAPGRTQLLNSTPRVREGMTIR